MLQTFFPVVVVQQQVVAVSVAAREAELLQLECMPGGYSGMAVVEPVDSFDRVHMAEAVVGERPPDYFDFDRAVVVGQPDRVVVGERPPDCFGFDMSVAVEQPDSSDKVHMAVAARSQAGLPGKAAGSAEQQAAVTVEQQAGY